MTGVLSVMRNRMNAKITSMRIVFFGVFTTTKYAKVFYSIIKLIVVNVMNYFVSFKASTDKFFDNNPMFKLIAVISPNASVTINGQVTTAFPIMVLFTNRLTSSIFRYFFTRLVGVSLALKRVSATPATLPYGQVITLAKSWYSRNATSKVISDFGITKPLFVVKAFKIGKIYFATNSMLHTLYYSTTLKYR